MAMHTAIGFEHFDTIAWTDTPPFPFAGRNVNLVLFADRTVTAEQVGHVVQRVVFDDELGSANHVDVVLDRHLGKEVQVLRA